MSTDNSMNSITFEQYQRLAERTLVHYLHTDTEARPQHALYGLLAEAGEVAEILQKVYRGDYGSDEAANKLRDELGDALWYLAEVCSAHGWSIADVAAVNIEKLQERVRRGTIQGSDRNE